MKSLLNYKLVHESSNTSTYCNGKRHFKISGGSCNISGKRPGIHLRDAVMKAFIATCNRDITFEAVFYYPCNCNEFKEPK